MAGTSRQEFVVGGHMPNGDVLDSFLVGYYEGRKLMYAASVRASIPTDYRRSFFHISKNCARHDAHSPTCQIGGEGRWGEVSLLRKSLRVGG
jgi:hypothetical protein